MRGRGGGARRPKTRPKRGQFGPLWGPPLPGAPAGPQGGTTAPALQTGRSPGNPAKTGPKQAEKGAKIGPF